MAIRIRVYPQPHSIGARRNRAARRTQQVIQQQRQQFALQQQLLRQQQVLQQQRAWGFSGAHAGALGGIPGALGGFSGMFGGVSNGYSAVPLPPHASSWGYVGQAAPSFGYQPFGSAWGGAYSLPTHAGAYGSWSSVDQYGAYC